jgi:hypothetical protein
LDTEVNAKEFALLLHQAQNRNWLP